MSENPVKSRPGWSEQYSADQLLDVPCPGCGAEAFAELATEFSLVIARCDRCSLVYTRTPRPDSQDHYAVAEAHFLNKYASIFRAEQSHPRDPTYIHHLAWLESHHPPGDLLDVGAHCGFFLRKARDRGWRTLGVEPSPVTSALARSQFDLDVRTGALAEVDLCDRLFDAVTMVDVFEHIGDPHSILRQIEPLLKPSGLLFIKVPNVRYVLFKHRVLRHVVALDDVFDAREHLIYYSLDTLTTTLSSSGFRVVQAQVPPPIPAGSKLRRGARRLGAGFARMLPARKDSALATDIAVLATRSKVEN